MVAGFPLTPLAHHSVPLHPWSTAEKLLLKPCEGVLTERRPAPGNRVLQSANLVFSHDPHGSLEKNAQIRREFGELVYNIILDAVRVIHQKKGPCAHGGRW